MPYRRLKRSSLKRYKDVQGIRKGIRKGFRAAVQQSVCVLDEIALQLLGVMHCLARCLRSIAAIAGVAVQALGHLARQCAAGDFQFSSPTDWLTVCLRDLLVLQLLGVSH